MSKIKSKIKIENAKKGFRVGLNDGDVVERVFNTPQMSNIILTLSNGKTIELPKGTKITKWL